MGLRVQGHQRAELFNVPTVFPYGATHASELQFLFDPNGFFADIDYPVPTDPFPLSLAEERLSRAMIRYWTNFAATRDPIRPGAGPGWSEERSDEDWPPYDSKDDNVQALTTPYPRPEFGFGAEHQCSFWAQLALESGL